MYDIATITKTNFIIIIILIIKMLNQVSILIGHNDLCSKSCLSPFQRLGLSRWWFYRLYFAEELYYIRNLSRWWWVIVNVDDRQSYHEPSRRVAVEPRDYERNLRKTLKILSSSLPKTFVVLLAPIQVLAALQIHHHHIFAHNGKWWQTPGQRRFGSGEQGETLWEARPPLWVSLPLWTRTWRCWQVTAFAMWTMVIMIAFGIGEIFSFKTTCTTFLIILLAASIFSLEIFIYTGMFASELCDVEQYHWSWMRYWLLSFQWGCVCSYLIFVIFFTRAKFLENKIYTEKRQFFALNL